MKKTFLFIFITIMNFCLIMSFNSNLGFSFGEETENTQYEEREDPTPEDPTPEDPTPEDPTPEDPTPEDPTPRDSGSVTQNYVDDRTSNVIVSSMDLSRLEINCGNLMPDFSPSITDYTVYAKKNNLDGTIKATAKDRNSKVDIKGSGEICEKTEIRKVIVTSTNGKSKTYNIKIIVVDNSDFLIDNKLYKVKEQINTKDIPKSFKKSKLRYKGMKLPVLKSNSGKYVVTEIKNYENNEDTKWMGYDRKKKEFGEIKIVNIKKEKFFTLPNTEHLLYGTHEKKEGLFVLSDSGDLIAISDIIDNYEKTKKTNSIFYLSTAIAAFLALEFAFLYIKEKRKMKFKSVVRNPYLGDIDE